MADSVRFAETLAGRLGPPDAPPDHPVPAARDTRFVLIVVTPDVRRLAEDPDHRSPAWGCLLAEWLSPDPLSVTQGHLDLFVDISGDRRAVEMRYRLDLRATDGRTFVLRGTKTLRRRFWLWTFPWDATTLTTTLHDADGALVAHGTMRQGVIGVLAQGATFRGSTLRGLLGFYRYYLGTVLGVYLRPPIRAPLPSPADRSPRS